MVLVQFIYWKIIDLIRFFKQGKDRKIHLYGITAIVGLYGGGKTMTLVHYLEEMKKRYGNRIYISTNFFYVNQDFPIYHWKDLLKEYDRPVIFAYDELQNDFNSREYKDFPTSLMTLLTQNRKCNGKRIIYTCQDYETVDKNFRRLTQNVLSCKTKAGRYVSVKQYDRENFEMLLSKADVSRRAKIRPNKWYSFCQTDYIRELYDSYQMLDSAKEKTYVDQINKGVVVNV